jgi:hypothetical protein
MDPMWLRTAVAAILLAGCAGVNQTASRPSITPVPPITSPNQPAQVIFLCNGSGSMAGAPEEFWRPMLCRLVRGLGSQQSFNVIFFQHVYDGAAESWFCALDDHPLPASDHNQAKALCFAQRHAVGDIGMPLDGIDEAFREHPDQILLLTNGNFADPGDEIVRQRVAGLNRAHHVRVDILILMDEMPQKQEESILAPLHQIAQENSGTCQPLYAYDRNATPTESSYAIARH